MISMNERAITAITDFMAKRSTDDFTPGSDKYEILKYGIAVWYYFITKTILLVVVAWALGILLYTLTFMAVFGILRRYARGLHFKSNFVCTAVGFANYIVGIFLAIRLGIGFIPTIGIYLLCFALNAIYAPSPTAISPIRRMDRPPLKIKTIVIMAVIFVLLLFLEDGVYRNIILIATITETVYVLPITYTIFRERRG